MNVKLKILRFDPQKDEKPYYQSFEVEADPMDRLLDCLIRIRGSRIPRCLSGCPALTASADRME